MERHVPLAWRDKIMHARLVVDGMALMGADVPPDSYGPSQNFAVSLLVKEPAEAERVFAALSENGKVGMPIQQTFWSVRFGMFVDQFDTPWMVNCEQAPA